MDACDVEGDPVATWFLGADEGVLVLQRKGAVVRPGSGRVWVELAQADQHVYGGLFDGVWDTEGVDGQGEGC